MNESSIILENQKDASGFLKQYWDNLLTHW